MDAALEQKNRLRSRARIGCRGWDPTMPGIGVGAGMADFLGASLRVPYQSTGKVFTELGTFVAFPYLFQLCTIGVGGGLWVTDMGLLSVIGEEQGAGGSAGVAPIFPNVLQQQTAAFRFSDCKPIRWGLRQLRKPTLPWSGMNVLNTNSFAWRYADNPALLYETATFPAANLNFYGTPDNFLALTSYAPPAAPYVFPGKPVGGGLGCFDSLDFPWQGPQRKSFEPIWVSGGGYLSVMAWVDQSDAETRSNLAIPGELVVPTTGIPENAFIKGWQAVEGSNTSGIVQFSVGAWLQVQYPSGERCIVSTARET
jgi:hypothetical protein